MKRPRGLMPIVVLALAAAMVALPFLFRSEPLVDEWQPGDPQVVVISPHNEAIRFEFGRAFSDWHLERYGQPVRVDWRVIGGTSEIMRYLRSEMVTSFRAWWRGQGREWPAGTAAALLASRNKPVRSLRCPARPTSAPSAKTTITSQRLSSVNST